MSETRSADTRAMRGAALWAPASIGPAPAARLPVPPMGTTPTDSVGRLLTPAIASSGSASHLPVNGAVTPVPLTGTGWPGTAAARTAIGLSS